MLKELDPTSPNMPLVTFLKKKPWSQSNQNRTTKQVYKQSNLVPRKKVQDGTTNQSTFITTIYKG